MRKRDRMRQGGVIFMTSFKFPQCIITPIGKEIDIAVFREAGKAGFSFRLDRRLARMLARRINQALDESK